MPKKTDTVISGISKHARQCTDGRINWDKPEILQVEKQKNKFPLQRNFLVRESLKIRKHNSDRNGYNDPQLQINTNAWDPTLRELQIIEQKRSFNGGHRD